MRLSYILIPTFLIICFIFGMLLSIINSHWVDFSVLEYNHGKPSILLDDEGNEWARFELDRRETTKFEHMPKHLIQAFVASEDRDFFKHSGLSWKGIIRSIIVNLYRGGRVQGASTITQQLVRLIFLNSEKTFERKIKEQFFSLLVETQYSKEQILETYLNNLYFGCGIYGVEAASQRFFSKSVKNITLDEAALLTAIIKCPGNYNPLLCPLSAQKLRNIVLYQMYSVGFITQKEYEDAKNIPLKTSVRDKSKIAPHLKETIRIFLEEQFGKQKLYCGGLRIQTTINKKIQQKAELEFIKQFKNLKKDIGKNVDGAMICMEPKTGEIKALIGGYDFSNSKLNRAHAKRQMGSIFKPIVYAAALQKGMNFTNTEIDEPIEVIFEGKKWQPQNSTRDFKGQMTLTKALSFSNNVISAKLILKIGCDSVSNLAKRFRFSDPLKPYPSLALGCVDATLEEAIGAFNVFANNGCYAKPYFIKWVKDEWGKKIYKAEPETEQILSPIISGQINKVLSISVHRQMEDKQYKGNAIGKTGTTNDSRTCWYCGATPNLTTALYIGCDDNSAMGKNVYAVRTVAPIWFNLYKKLDKNDELFQFDPSLREININWTTGETSNDLQNSDVVPILIPG